MPEASELRARPTDFCMSDYMSFQQSWQYRTTWPLADVLHDQFFMPMRASLRSGDQITLCRYNGIDQNHRDIELLEWVKVIIAYSRPDAQFVSFSRMSEIVIVGGVKAKDYKITAGKNGKHVLMNGDAVVREYGSKGEAEAALTAAA